MKDYILKSCQDGSVITVNDLQKELLVIMDEIHRICVKNEIEYALIAGSALGICNYQGFIPWDDDMDICVLRKDWDRFIRALSTDLSDEFYFQCFEVDSRYNVLIPSMKIRKKHTYVQEVNYLLENRCDGDGIFIDVVVYDNVADSRLADQLWRTPIRFWMPILVYLDNLGFQAVWIKKRILSIAEQYGRRYPDSRYISQTIAVVWEKWLREPIFLKEDVLPFRLYEFEGRQYYSYNHLEKVMKEWYGSNCLTTWNGREWIDPLPEKYRIPKHVKDISLDRDTPDLRAKNKGRNLVRGITLAVSGIVILLMIFKRKRDNNED
ncbi:MAG: LicD family protein [Lachnospiraceae bacterium]|nr:LicD family protein [Lachnospiraceae bacterium]